MLSEEVRWLSKMILPSRALVLALLVATITCLMTSGLVAGEALAGTQSIEQGAQIRTLHTGSFPAWCQANDLITFTDKDPDTGQYEVYTMRPDGSDVTCVTKDKPALGSCGNRGQSYWHPSGDWITFHAENKQLPRLPWGASARPGFGRNYNIWITDANGDNSLQVTDYPTNWAVFEPTFSRDGTKLCWGEEYSMEMYPNGKPGDKIMPWDNPTGPPFGHPGSYHTAEQFEYRVGEEMLAWRIVYADVSFDSGRPVVSGIKKLPVPAGYTLNEVNGFTPDDQGFICCFSVLEETNGRASAGELFTVDLEGNLAHRITNTKFRHDEDPCYSPDGSLLAYKETRGIIGYEDDIYLADSDGSGIQRLTHFAEEGYREYDPIYEYQWEDTEEYHASGVQITQMCFSPDGGQILFGRCRSWAGSQESIVDVPSYLYLLTIPQEFRGSRSGTGRTGSITGVVKAMEGTPLEGCHVEAYDSASGRLAATGTTDVAGSFCLNGLATGSYRIFSDPFDTDYAREWYQDKARHIEADPVDVTEPLETQVEDIVLSNTSSISGRLTDEEYGQECEGYVCVWESQTLLPVKGVLTLDGLYTNSALDPGSYCVSFAPSGNYFSEWYEGWPTMDSADLVVLSPGQHLGGIDASLLKGGRILGQVKEGSGEPVGGCRVKVFGESGTCVRESKTGAEGGYDIGPLEDGSYLVYYDPPELNTIPQWYEGAADMGSADPVEVRPSQPTVVNATLSTGGSMTGTVFDNETGNPLEECWVEAYRSPSGGFAAATTAGTDGKYEISRLPTGDYLVHFGPCGKYTPEWFPGALEQADATVVKVIDPERTRGIDVGLSSACRIDSCVPAQALQGESLEVRIVGSGTHFVEGISVADFGTGITVNNTLVSDAEHITAIIEVGADSLPGVRRVGVKTAGENPEELIGGFKVLEKPNPSASTFYFAEGTTRPNFAPYFCIQNPGGSEADVKITFMKGDGTTAEHTLTVGKNSRSTVAATDILGVGDDPSHDFSARVECTNNQQIVAERPMYFNYGGAWTGGHDVVGFNP